MLNPVVRVVGELAKTITRSPADLVVSVAVQVVELVLWQ